MKKTQANAFDEEEKNSVLLLLAKIEDESNRTIREVAAIREIVCKKRNAWIDVQEMLSPSSGLSVRARKALQRLGVETMQDINALTSKRLMADKNISLTAACEIREWLAARGVSVP